MSDFLTDLFPTEDSIPVPARLPAFIEQREYLIHGELRTCQGKLRVFSIRTLVAAKSTNENKLIVGNILKNRESEFLNTDYIF